MERFGSSSKWNLLGVFGEEERSLGVFEHLSARGILDSKTLLQIEEDASKPEWNIKRQELREDRISEFLALGGDTNDINVCSLMSTNEMLVEIANRAAEDSYERNLILDI